MTCRPIAPSSLAFRTIAENCQSSKVLSILVSEIISHSMITVPLGVLTSKAVTNGFSDLSGETSVWIKISNLGIWMMSRRLLLDIDIIPPVFCTRSKRYHSIVLNVCQFYSVLLFVLIYDIIKTQFLDFNSFYL